MYSFVMGFLITCNYITWINLMIFYIITRMKPNDNYCWRYTQVGIYLPLLLILIFFLLCFNRHLQFLRLRTYFLFIHTSLDLWPSHQVRNYWKWIWHDNRDFQVSRLEEPLEWICHTPGSGVSLWVNLGGRIKLYIV